MKWCELREYKWNEYVTIAVNRNLSNCENSPKKRFSGLQREHCSANAEATGSNPVEAPKIFFSGYFRNCLNCDSLRWSHTHFICIPAVHIISFSVSFLSRVDEFNKLAGLQCMGLHSSAGEHCSANAEATGSNPVEALKIFFSGYFRNCLNCDSLRWSHTHFIYYYYYYYYYYYIYLFIFSGGGEDLLSEFYSI